MSGIEFYVLDSETNGLKTDFHELTQVCCIRVRDKMQYDCTIRAEYPERSQAMALQITGKTHDDLRQGIDNALAVKDFETFIKSDGLTPAHRCIIAHNASFDRRFLHALWTQKGQPFPADLWVDTIPMVRSYAVKQGMIKPKVKLENAMTILGSKKVSGVHNAISDARNLYFVWKTLLEREEEYLCHVKRVPHITSTEEKTTEDDDDNCID